jgi:hypothetical protein
MSQSSEVGELNQKPESKLNGGIKDPKPLRCADVWVNCTCGWKGTEEQLARATSTNVLYQTGCPACHAGITLTRTACTRDPDAKCHHCGKSFCGVHVILHLKNQHQVLV